MTAIIEHQTDSSSSIKTKHAGQQGLSSRSDGKIFATAGWDARVRVYSTRTMRELAVLQWHQQGCYAYCMYRIIQLDYFRRSIGRAERFHLFLFCCKYTPHWSITVHPSKDSMRIFRTPNSHLAVLKDLPMEELETINPFTLAPWEKRIQTVVDETTTEKAVVVDTAVHLAVNCSARDGLVGIGGATQLAMLARSKPKRKTFYTMIGT
ncbi:ASTRA-associated protein 1 [Exophiala oligosperma]|uniref:ASTRA-associated protein 1 n=1 Tax=Exophiala oligosperma TaxID=215243 RepID=A0A0D2D1U2_9EURO|nr:ASTRA-associated protein 1 [Exophiala oligosperma]KIW36180.1 ASTRA-associated protein 1 [Exophiala oligosperma]